MTEHLTPMEEIQRLPISGKIQEAFILLSENILGIRPALEGVYVFLFFCPSRLEDFAEPNLHPS